MSYHDKRLTRKLEDPEFKRGFHKFTLELEQEQAGKKIYYVGLTPEDWNSVLAGLDLDKRIRAHILGQLGSA